MNREDVVALASRLFAIYLFVLGLQFIVSAVSLNSLDEGMVPLFMIIAVSTIILGIVSFLWVFPLTVARKFLPTMKDSAAGQPLNSTTAFGLGLTLFGVWLFAYSLSDLLFWTVFWVKTRAAGDAGFVITPGNYANMASAAFRYLLSLFLILGSTGIRNALLRLRYGRAPDGF